jgi:hypothetical protein
VKTDSPLSSPYAKSSAPRSSAISKVAGPQKNKDSSSSAAAGADYKLDLSSASVGASAVGAVGVAGAAVSALGTSSPATKVKIETKIEKTPLELQSPQELQGPKKTSKASGPRPKEASLAEPAIIFIKGLDLFSSPLTSEGGYAGIEKMASSLEGAQVFSWDDKNGIIEEIKKRTKSQPIILVGHSLGGDTAHEVSEELDSLDHQFRKVDLLVTIDAFGMGHDIIPQNVREHLNIFGESSFFLNDGPHVARRHEMTKVQNILSPRDHTELDDDREIQYEIVTLINEVLGKGPANKSV